MAVSQKVTSSIKAMDLEEMVELNQYLVTQIRAERTLLSRRAKLTLRLGQTVKFEGNDGEIVQGELIKKMRKFAQVRVNSGFRALTWRVPMNMLEVVQ